jgi:hypothetical protein
MVFFNQLITMCFKDIDEEFIRIMRIQLGDSPGTTLSPKAGGMWRWEFQDCGDIPLHRPEK